jgi:hypothetical protein
LLSHLCGYQHSMKDARRGSPLPEPAIQAARDVAALLDRPGLRRLIQLARRVAQDINPSRVEGVSLGRDVA